MSSSNSWLVTLTFNGGKSSWNLTIIVFERIILYTLCNALIRILLLELGFHLGFVVRSGFHGYNSEVHSHDKWPNTYIIFFSIFYDNRGLLMLEELIMNGRRRGKILKSVRESCKHLTNWCLHMYIRM